MKAIFLGDKDAYIFLTSLTIDRTPLFDEVRIVESVDDALSYFKENDVNIAILDTGVREINALSVAKTLRSYRENLPVIILSESSEYALEAFSFHASGYILKPIKEEIFISEIKYALKNTELSNGRKPIVRTFGEFDVLIGEKPIYFSRAKSKELLAYLVDRQGGSVTRPTVFAALFEDGFYNRSMQKYLDTIIRSLRKTLNKYGISDILETGGGTLRIRPDKIECDFYRFCEGDREALKSYRGEYMSAYSWANMVEAYLDRIKEEKG